MDDRVLGIDIGGSGIKGAPVDVRDGELVGERHRLRTPRPADPDSVGAALAHMAKHFTWSGPVGCGFPGTLRDGVVSFAPNLDQSWIGRNAESIFRTVTDLPVAVINDADAAGLAEMKWGAGRGHRGLVLLLTFGSGIGSALTYDGKLVPNTELGHVLLHGMKAEHYAAADVRKRQSLTYEEWGDRVNEYLAHIEQLFSPELIIVGGGVSRNFARFSNRLTIETPVQPARLRNRAGMVGAALWASMAL